METDDAIRVMSALAQPTRLATVRLLLEAGEGGMAAGEISRSLDVPTNTMSAHLTILGAAGLVRQARSGRSVIYTAIPERAAAVTRFLADIAKITE